MAGEIPLLLSRVKGLVKTAKAFVARKARLPNPVVAQMDRLSGETVDQAITRELAAKGIKIYFGGVYKPEDADQVADGLVDFMATEGPQSN